MEDVIESVLQGNRRTLARLLTDIENEREGIESILATLFLHTGNAHVIGVTGAPGTGKSTLVTRMVQAYRERDMSVAILAVDPSSPFSGGAILGDRVRMQELSGDKGVFIRSMASRGNPGGLSYATRDVIRVFDAAGFDKIIVETVGAGQSEIDIVRLAHTTIVVEAPGLGDGIQAIKAGILEIADILVVNKADHPGVTNTVRSLNMMLEIGHPTKANHTRHHGMKLDNDNPEVDADTAVLWIPPIVETIATEKKGISELINQIKIHNQYSLEHKQRNNQEQMAISHEFFERLKRALLDEYLAQFSPNTHSYLLARILARDLSPVQAVQIALAARNKTSPEDLLHDEHSAGNTL